jgi:hypothetical protein
MLIKSINLGKARFMDFYQVLSLVFGFLTNKDLTELNLAHESGDFITVFEIFDKALKEAQKTGYIDRIVTADDNRNEIINGFTGSLINMTRFPDAEIAGIAVKLLMVFEKYGAEAITRLPHYEATTLLTDIVNEIGNAVNIVVLQKTGLYIWVEKLAEANLAFENLYAHHTLHDSEFITGLSFNKRKTAQATFEKLIHAIEANACLNGEAACNALADKINSELTMVKKAAKNLSSMNWNHGKPGAGPEKLL